MGPKRKTKIESGNKPNDSLDLPKSGQEQLDQKTKKEFRELEGDISATATDINNTNTDTDKTKTPSQKPSFYEAKEKEYEEKRKKLEEQSENKEENEKFMFKELIEIIKKFLESLKGLKSGLSTESTSKTPTTETKETAPTEQLKTYGESTDYSAIEGTGDRYAGIDLNNIPSDSIVHDLSPSFRAKYSKKLSDENNRIKNIRIVELTCLKHGITNRNFIMGLIVNAWKESKWKTSAHNTKGEDSGGLFQIKYSPGRFDGPNGTCVLEKLSPPVAFTPEQRFDPVICTEFMIDQFLKKWGDPIRLAMQNPRYNNPANMAALVSICLERPSGKVKSAENRQYAAIDIFGDHAGTPADPLEMFNDLGIKA